ERLQRGAADDGRSPSDVPLVDRAGTDGVAVVAPDTIPAGKTKPVTLRRIETLYANGVPRERVAPGRCTVVATGSMLPKGADAVVMVEDTESEGGPVKVYSPVRPGENVTRRGEGLARKSPVVATGESWAA